MPPLPAAVQRKADEATRLVNAAAATKLAPVKAAPAAATPAPAPAALDAAALQKQLADTQEQLRQSEERYKSLDGKYKAETPKAHEQLRTALAEKKALEEKVKVQEAEQKRLLEAHDVSGLSAAERQTAGEDLVKTATKIATEVAGRVFDAKSAETLKRLDMLEQMSEEAYYVTLDMNVPNWKVVNDEPGFIAWLNLLDPATKRVRMDILRRADAARQGNMMAEIFLAYIEKREIGAPLAAAPLPKPAANGLENRVDAPAGGGSTTVAQVDDEGKRIWTRAEIKNHYDAKTRGEWRGRLDEWRKIEEEQFAARREGRVR